MCSEYQAKTTTRDIERALGAPVRNATGEIKFDLVVRMATRAPVLAVADDGEIELQTRIFPVSPFPNARLSGFENQSDGPATENSENEKQIRRIYDVPRWKTDFKSSPILIPMTSFTEFAYWGSEAGHALGFSIGGEPLFFAAAIATKPFKPSTGHKDGFALITHTATKQMLEHHQRLIVLLKPDVAAPYLSEMTPSDRFDFLIENRFTQELEIEKLRSMAKGWIKRSDVQKAKLNRETEYRQILRIENVEG